MAKIFGQDRETDFAASNLMSFGKSFSRMGGQPLDESEVWYDKSALDTFAASTAAYVGMKVAYVDVDAQKVYQYSIQLDGSLKEIGVAPVSDGATIAVDTETGKLSLYGVADLESGKTYVPSIVNGVLTWAEPDTSTAEGQQTAIDGLTTRMATAEGEIDALQTSSDTHTADIAAINTKIGTVTEGKTVVDMIADAQTAATYDDTGVKADIKTNADAIAAEQARAEAAEAQALTDAKAYTDEVKAAILGEGITETFDTLVEVQKWIDESGVDAAELSTAIAAETTARQEADAALESKITTAKTDSVSEANAYTDGKVTELNTALAGKANTTHNHEISAITGLQDALDNKETSGAAAQALTDAKAYTDEVKSTLESSIAGLSDVYDAKGSADSALTDAKDYTDTEIDALADVYDAKGAASTALSDAKNYTDEQIAGVTTSITQLNSYVGSIPEGYTETNIVAYINKKAEETLNSASGGSSESAASVLAALNTYKSENDPKVTANTNDIATLKTDVASINTAISAIVQPKASTEVTVADDGTLGLGEVSTDKLVQGTQTLVIKGGSASSF